MRNTFKALAEEITVDGKVDANEASAIRALVFADGSASREEAELVIDINNRVSGKDNSPRFDALYTEVVTASVLEDSATPGVVSEEEGQWLVNQFSGDGQIDRNERTTLATIKARATSLPASVTALMAQYGI
jgi:hypothetical protein